MSHTAVPYDIIPPLQLSAPGHSVNFLSSAKERDWRFKAYERLKRKQADAPTARSLGHHRHEEIFWIGIINLETIRKNPAGPYEIGFVDAQGNHVKDTFRKRNNDGSDYEGDGNWQVPCLYTLPQDMLQFLKRKIEKTPRVFEMFIREVVRDDGMHWVWLLKCETAPEYLRWGLATHAPWYDRAGGSIRWMTEFGIAEAHKQIPILVEKPYQFLK